MDVIFAWLALVSLVWMIAASIAIVRDLESRGVKIKYLAIRIMVGSYAGQYRAHWLKETGHVPALYYHFVISAVFMWVFVVAALLTVKW